VLPALAAYAHSPRPVIARSAIDGARHSDEPSTESEGFPQIGDANPEIEKILAAYEAASEPQGLSCDGSMSARPSIIQRLKLHELLPAVAEGAPHLRPRGLLPRRTDVQHRCNTGKADRPWLIYQGSETTPNCGPMTWLVLQDRARVSQGQIFRLTKLQESFPLSPAGSPLPA
jgi:hypothetical protein